MTYLDALLAAPVIIIIAVFVAVIVLISGRRP